MYRAWSSLLLVLCLASCSWFRPQKVIPIKAELGSPADPNTVLSFSKHGTDLGLLRSNEPASLSSCGDPGSNISHGNFPEAWGSDYTIWAFSPNHGMSCHLSGLWKWGGPSFGQNIWTGAFTAPGPNWIGLASLGSVSAIYDLVGHGRPDIWFLSWNGVGGFCSNQGSANHSDWSGPGFFCYMGWEPYAFGDINGDGKMDVQTVSGTWDLYSDQLRTQPSVWRLNNGSQNPNTWSTTNNPLTYIGHRGFIDFDKDGIPDKIEGVPLSPAAFNFAGQRKTSGVVVSLGQVNNGVFSYVAKPNTGIEGATDPFADGDEYVRDINQDGCLDVSFDPSKYNFNKDWWLQVKTNGVCTVTFVAVTNTTYDLLGFFAGAHTYRADLDNDGVDEVVSIVRDGLYTPSAFINGVNTVIHGGVHVYKKTAAGYTDLGNLGMEMIPFYGDSLAFSDFDGDGDLDIFMQSGGPVSGSDNGILLYRNDTTTANHHLSIRTNVASPFTGYMKIEIFDHGYVGDVTHYVVNPRKFYTGETWPMHTHVFGLGTRSPTVDARVTFPDGTQTTQVATVDTTILITPTPNVPPVASITASPTSAVLGQAVVFDGSGSSDSDGTLVPTYAWQFGDGSSTTTSSPTAQHSYTAPGNYTAQLTVTDNNGSTGTSTAVVSVADVVPPTLTITGVTCVVTASATDDSGTVTNVTWKLDNNAQTQVSTSPYTFSIDYLSMDPGQHTIQGYSTDGSGNASAVQSVSITKP